MNARYFVNSTDAINFGNADLCGGNLLAMSVHFRAKFDAAAINTSGGTIYNLISQWGSSGVSAQLFKIYKQGLALHARIQYSTWVMDIVTSDMGIYPSSVPDTSWHSYLLTWDASTNVNGKLYKDGVLYTSTASGNIGYVIHPTSSILIGNAAGVGLPPPGVAIRDIGIWRSSLSGANATSLASGSASNTIATGTLRVAIPLGVASPETTSAGLSISGTVTGATIVSADESFQTSMFPPSYFAARYFARRYFPSIGGPYLTTFAPTLDGATLVAPVVCTSSATFVTTLGNAELESIAGHTAAGTASASLTIQLDDVTFGATANATSAIFTAPLENATLSVSAAQATEIVFSATLEGDSLSGNVTQTNSATFVATMEDVALSGLVAQATSSAFAATLGTATLSGTAVQTAGAAFAATTEGVSLSGLAAQTAEADFAATTEGAALDSIVAYTAPGVSSASLSTFLDDIVLFAIVEATSASFTTNLEGTTLSGVAGQTTGAAFASILAGVSLASTTIFAFGDIASVLNVALVQTEAISATGAPAGAVTRTLESVPIFIEGIQIGSDASGSATTTLSMSEVSATALSLINSASGPFATDLEGTSLVSIGTAAVPGAALASLSSTLDGATVALLSEISTFSVFATSLESATLSVTSGIAVSGTFAISLSGVALTAHADFSVLAGAGATLAIHLDGSDFHSAASPITSCFLMVDMGPQIVFALPQFLSFDLSDQELPTAGASLNAKLDFFAAGSLISPLEKINIVARVITPKLKRGCSLAVFLMEIKEQVLENSTLFNSENIFITLDPDPWPTQAGPFCAIRPGTHNLIDGQWLGAGLHLAGFHGTVIVRLVDQRISDELGHDDIALLTLRDGLYEKGLEVVKSLTSDHAENNFLESGIAQRGLVPRKISEPERRKGDVRWRGVDLEFDVDWTHTYQFQGK